MTSSPRGILQQKNLIIGDDHDEQMHEADILSLTEALAGQPPRWYRISSFATSLSTDITTVEVNAFCSCISATSPLGAHLLKLSLEGSGLGFTGISLLLDKIRQSPLSALETLNISRNFAESQGISKLVKLLRDQCLPSLCNLYIAGNSGMSAIMLFFENVFAIEVPHLTRIDVSNNNVDLTTDFDILAMMAKENMTISHLHNVNLSFNPLGDAGFKKLLQIFLRPGNTFRMIEQGDMYVREDCDSFPLVALNVENCDLSTASMGSLGDCFLTGKFWHLEELAIGLNHLSRICLAPLYESMREGKLSALRVLKMNLIDIGNEGVHELICNLNEGIFDALETLDISDTGSSSDSIFQFASNFSIRSTRNPNAMRMKQLALFGMQTLLRTRIKTLFRPELLRKVKIS